MLPVLPESVSVVLFVPVHTVAAPAMLPATEAGETVTVLVAVASAQPPVPVIVYEIVAVPAATLVTTPEEFTVAIFVFELDQVPFA